MSNIIRALQNFPAKFQDLLRPVSDIRGFRTDEPGGSDIVSPKNPGEMKKKRHQTGTHAVHALR